MIKKIWFRSLSHNLLIHLILKFLTLSGSNYQFASESSNSPDIKTGCQDSCCNTKNVLTKSHKTINILIKGEERNLLINLISQIDNLELKKEYLKKLKETMIRDEHDKRVKTKIKLAKTLERFNNKKVQRNKY